MAQRCFAPSCIVSAVLALVALVTPARAQEPTGTSSAPQAVTSSVDAFHGLYTETATIAVPPFHGIEPKLAISYSSTVSNGFAGVGWTLSGASVIERAAPGKGAPHYDGNDIYLLDGSTLVPCASGSVSPSCTTGGTHSTQIETYSRISHDTPTDTWTIWQKNGTTAVYAPVYGVSVPLTTCTTVTPTVSGGYAPFCDGSGCYSDVLGFSAGGTVINFYVHRTSFDGSSMGTGVVPGLVLGGGAVASGDYQGEGVFYVFPGSSNNLLNFSSGWSSGNLSFQGATVSGFYQDQLAGDPDVQSIIASGNRITFANGFTTGTVTLGPGVVCSTAPAPVTFRYGLVRTTDTSGNSVVYNWSCDPGADCYLDNVTYNRTTVKLYREARPDPIAFANGSYIGHTNFRLKSVDVLLQDSTNATKRVRAYKLGYATSSASGRSQLTSVQMVGRDATVDASGNIAGGMALPAALFGYSSASLGATDNVTGSLSAAVGTGVPTASVGDFNGDGKMDYGYRDANGVTMHVVVSNGSSMTDQVWGSMAAAPSTGPFEGGFGDFNGDGKTDFLYRAGNTRDMHVLLANASGTGFLGDSIWITKAADPGSSLVQECVADFNGDGKADYLYRQSNTSNLRVLLSSGGSFVSDSVWGIQAANPTVDANNPFEGGCSDFNGDGKADYMYRAGNDLHVLLSSGSAFQADSVWGTKVAAAGVGPYEGGMVDVNGDGKTDYAYRAANTQTMHVLLSQGNGFVADTVWGTKGHAAGVGPYEGGWADVNGDGLTDYVYRASNTNQMFALLSTGGSFQADQAWATHAGTASTNVSDMPLGGFADINGDGRTDYLYLSGGSVRVIANGAPIPDLLTTANNGYGGLVALTYTPSSTWVNTNGVPLVQTVSSQTVSDGRGQSATSSYSFAGGLWDPLGRQFLGFRYAKAVAPCIAGETQCPYSETWFKQDFGSVSKRERVDRRDGAGTLLLSEQFQYTTNGGTLPYQSLDTGHWLYVYDSTGASRRTFVGRSYDNLGFDANGLPVWGRGYANVVQEVSYGDFDATGDEKTIRYVYVPNAAAYIVGKPAVLDTFAGTNTQGMLLAETLYYYDGQTTWNAAPIACGSAPCGGKATQTLAWLNTSNTFVTAMTGYDAYGNVTSETDRNGAVTLSEYDPVFHLYMTKRTNALGQVGTAEWDAICAIKTVQTDANLLRTTYQTDALCRSIRVDIPGGGFRITSFNNFGDPNNQYVQTETPGADSSGNLWSRVYQDGLGRSYRTVAKGAATGLETYSDTQFNARGGASAASEPRFASATPVWTTNSYDALDRPVRVTHADGTFLTRSYQVDRNTATDELGHSIIDFVDAAGHVVQRRETIGGTSYATTYTYDARGYATGIVDSAGNAWTFSTDSLGRRTQVVDPDAGTSNFTFDAGDRLVTQSNALWTTSFAYDAIGRKVSRQAQMIAGGPVSTVTWAYDEVTAGFFNIGQVTTTTDPSGSATYNHDAAGNAVAWQRTIDGTVYDFRSAFDLGGRPLWTQYPDGDLVGSADSPLRYDGAGRPIAIPGLVTGASYDAAGRLVSLANANGTTTTAQYSATRSWINSMQTTLGSSGTAVDSLDYSNRDAEGKLMGVSSSVTGDTFSYRYDDAHRLVSATITSSAATETQTLTYDPIGNILSNSRVGAYTYARTGGAGPHAVTQAGSQAYSYDATGNMIAGGGRTLTYDFTGMPTSINGIAFFYDADNARIKKVNGSTTTHYLAGDSVEVNASKLTKYISLGGMLVAKRVDATPFWLHIDAQGSIRAVTDASGAVVQRQEYRPYGEQLLTPTAHTESRGYTGQRQDETGLFYLHARYYDPLLARFVAADPTFPASTAVGLNRYAYAGNDPINHTDVDGLGAFSIFKQVFNDVSIGLNLFVPGAGEFLQIAGYFMSAATAAEAGVRGGFGSFLRAAGGEAISQVTSALTAGLGSDLSRPTQIAIHSAIGFGSGFASALESGASPGAALKGASIGALESTAVSFGEMAVQSFKESSTTGAIAAAPQDKGHKGKGHGLTDQQIVDNIQFSVVLNNSHLVVASPEINYGEGKATYGDLHGDMQFLASRNQVWDSALHIAVHGGPQSVSVPVKIDGHVKNIEISAHTFAMFIRQRTEFTEGRMIHLSSCETGKGANPFARQLSIILSTKGHIVPVNAPSKVVPSYSIYMSDRSERICTPAGCKP